MPVRYTRFVGLDNSNDPVKHSLGDGRIKLSKADNVDITRTFSVRRRDGYSLWKNGAYNSLWSNGDVCFASTADRIVSFSKLDGYGTVIKILPVGEYPLSFIDSRTGYVYFTNGSVIGKIKDNVAYDLGTSSDKFKAPLPAGQFLSYLSPRLLVARGNVIFISDPVNKDVYHQHMGFIQFDSEIRMIAPLSSGNMFVSDSRYTWFLEKMQRVIDVPAPLFKLRKVASYPAIEGNPFRHIDGFKTELAYYPDGAMWVSETGICVGGADGAFENLTDKKYNMPSVMQSACVECRTVGDLNLFITVIKGVR